MTREKTRAMALYARQALGLTAADFGTDPLVAAHVLAGLAYLASRGLALPPRLRIRAPRHGRRFATTAEAYGLPGLDYVVAAMYTPYTRPLLEINPDPYRELMIHGDPDHVPGGVFSTLTHECGHHAHWLHVGEDRYLALAKRRLTPRQRQLGQAVSTAAAHDVCEFVAETFVGLSTGHTYPPAVLALYRTFNGPPPLEDVAP